MRTNHFQTILKTAARAGSILLLAAVAAFGQQTVNLTAGPANATLPDGSTAPMWGYTCGGVVAGSTATCAPLNKNVVAGGWSPVLITVPTGQSLTINLTNNLSFLPVGTSTANSLPTSLVIVGQVGGGLGNSATSTASPVHNSQEVTWSTVGAAPAFFPPPQGPRVQSFSTEVAAGATTSLTWTNPRPGTYLLESGTHPSIQGPMGLYGVLVVTTAPVGTTAGTAYPAAATAAAVSYNAEIPLEFSEIDPVQNAAVNTAVNTPGFNEVTTRTFGEQVGSITVTGGGSGYTANPTVTVTSAVGFTGTNATATASVGAVITGIAVTNPGSGYTTAPAVTITDTVAPITAASAVAIVTFAVGTITAPVAGTGTGYAVGDVVNLTGGGGSGAAASVASVSGTGAILTVTVTSGGSGYTSAPTVASITSTAGVGGTGLTVALAATGVVSAINVTNGGSGYTSPVVTIAAPTTGTTATAVASIAGTHGVIYSVTVTNGGAGYHVAPTVTIAAPTSGTTATAVANVSQSCTGGLPCYPSAVNYTPLYYMINGVAFNKTNASASLFATSPATGVTGNVLVRMVNAGVRMHVPSILGSLTLPSGATTPPTIPTQGFSLVAEDGNPLPGVQRVQNEVFMAAGKTYDVMITAPTAATALPVYDRELSLSGNSTGRDAGMLAYISANSAGLPAAGAFASAVANADTYNSVVPCTAAPCTPLTVSDPSKGVIANDINVYGVRVSTPPAKGTLTLNANGTFTYVPNVGWTAPDTFVYQANGTGPTATVTLIGAMVEAASGIHAYNRTYTPNTATSFALKSPGVLGTALDTSGNPADSDTAGYPLTLNTATIVPSSGLTIIADREGGFTASVTAAGVYTFTYQAQNSQGTSSAAATVTLNFPMPSNLQVTVLDGYDKTTQITDYRWIIEEDRSFYINPACTQNPPPAGCPTASLTNPVVPTLGVNFHTSYMPFVALGCTGPISCEAGQMMIDPTTGAHVPTACDQGDGVCRTGVSQKTAVMPSQVHLDPTKHYYISVLPGDAATPFGGGYGGQPTACASTPATSTPGTSTTCGHGMGGAPVACIPTAPAVTCSGTGTFPAVTVLSQPSPYPTGKFSVFVFEDDFPLNGEHDSGGGIDVLGTNEPGLGGFQVHLWDTMSGNGDFTGQMSYDMFNQPLSNSLAGTIDPTTGLDACPISVNPLSATSGASPTTLSTDPTATGMTGMIVTCPRLEGDGVTLSPLAGQAVVANLMPGRWVAIVTPGADRIARGEEWLQTNTLDGQKGHDSFIRIGEPNFFQEFGPAGFHVTVGFANPKIINSRKAGVCGGTDPNITGNCTPGNTLTGKITGQRLSRTPDERLYESGSRDTFFWTQCFVSVGDADGEDFAFTKCDAQGNFTFTGLPDGDWRITTFDQWNDQLVDGLSTPVRLGNATQFCPGTGSSQHYCNMGNIASTQWQTNLYTRTFVDDNRNGVSDTGEGGIPLLNVAVRLRDGSLGNLLLTDFNGIADFNETFPLFSWYTVETDTTRYKNTGTHVVYDVGGPADGSTSCLTPKPGDPPCGTAVISQFLANTLEKVSVPANLRVPGAVYCANADCTGKSVSGLNGSNTSDPPSVCTESSTGAITCSTTLSSGRIDPPWVGVEGWQGFPGQNNFIEFGKAPYYPGENGGIKGHVVYAATRPFDDPQMLVQTQWTPLIPNVTMNLYHEGFAADSVTPTLTLVDTTKTSSFDDWAQGFRADGVTPNMNCPGQGQNTGVLQDLFYYSLFNQPSYLNWYNSQHGGPAVTPLPFNSQFKCYDGMHNWNQIQPAPYDGAYQFPSVTSVNANGRPTGTNCTICILDPVPTTGEGADPLRAGLPMLPPGKYVVEVVLPPGYELVKEEDKNILIGDNFIAPVTQQFGGLGNIFILPDQASAASTNWAGQGYNPNNPQNPTQSFGAIPENSIVPSFVPEPVWPCVGEARIVPDYISMFPQTHQVSPFAGATRNLCDRKEVTLSDQAGAIAKFWLFTTTHIASKFTGGITDDFTSEFDPFAPTFGEKFSPANLPVALKDWTGNEISRVYADHWGAYDGVTYSTWEVNPPNPTGYSPTMMVVCINDPGTGTTPDPLFNTAYSDFCYELPFMPGTTQYLDTPVVPTSAFAGVGYNNPDCNYPANTPAISEVDGDGVGPWISAVGTAHPITIYALGNVPVNNYGYSGPAASTSPFNQKTVTRHYGFGNSGTVTIGGVTATVSLWSDQEIVVTLPTTGPPVPMCSMQQQAQYSGSNAQCGELVITRADNGLQSIDTVTVTIGGKAPTHVAAAASIQGAIDAAAPGDLLIVDPTTPATAASAAVPSVHQELVIMWKPVRLQGVGAASSVINANTHPAGKLTAWRQRVNCLFGLAINGAPYSANSATATPVPPATSPNPYDPTGAVSCPGTGWNYFNADGGSNDPQVDRLPLEGIVGWDATVNGNLAELLQEPSLMGAYEGAGITVLARGVRFPCNPSNASTCFVFGNGPDSGSVATESQFPLGSVPLGPLVPTPGQVVPDSDPDCNTQTGGTGYASNFRCNPSSIDGLSVTNSSQGGGGIFLHAWVHNMEIANNRVYNNTGTLTGGIVVGQGESPDALLNGNGGNPIGFDQQPWTCYPGGVVGGMQQQTIAGLAAGTQLPYCYDTNVSVHHNYVTTNSSIGDEVFSGTPAGAGGATFCIGADYYKFNYNWVCGNLSSGDGGGVAHIGFIWNGDIEHNTIIFNQSTNPTIATNGGGIIAMGAAPDGVVVAGPECGSVTDVDCAPGLSDGTGPKLVINANLLMGNAAESGSGGGVRFQSVNGTDVIRFPLGPIAAQPLTQGWNDVLVTNNIIANNVAGWDGGGVSMQDSLIVNFINNTVVSNDTTASAGVLFNTIGAPLASAPGCNPPSCTQTTSATTSAPQPAGLVSTPNSSNLTAAIAALTPVLGVRVLCPPGHATGALPDGNCRQYSVPVLYNDLFWQNRSFYIGVGSLGTGKTNQQNVVSLFNSFTTNQVTTQSGTDATTANGGGRIISGGTGACVSGASYWDIGVRGDTSQTVHSSGLTLVPQASFLTSTAGYPGGGLGFRGNSQSNPTVVQQYCNGSRVPPEYCAGQANCTPGWQVPPGIADATVPNPIFNLTPAATVDEGNNWININWGPLALSNPVTNTLLGNYALAPGSPAINYITPGNSFVTYAVAPNTDFFGNGRKGNLGSDTLVEVGAVEFVATGSAGSLTVTPATLSFGNEVVGQITAVQPLTLTNSGTAQVTGITLAFASSPTNTTGGSVFTRAGGSCPAAILTTGIALGAGNSCTVTVVFTPTAVGAYTGTATFTASVGVINSPVGLNGTGITAPTIPTLTVLDNFNRANGPLGGNWGLSLITVNDVTAGNTSTGTAFCAIPCGVALPAGNAVWTAGAAFGAKQGAAVTISNATLVGDALLLDASGTPAGSIYPNNIRVSLTSTTEATVATTTNGLIYTTAGTVTAPSAWLSGDVLTAEVDGIVPADVAAPTVYIWRTRSGVTTFIGAVQIPAPNAAFSNTPGRIGIQMPTGGSRVDNFSGATVP
jgi:hypothetical protein